MACDLGLNLDSGGMYSSKDTTPDDAAEDARRITFWGCFLFDKYVSITLLIVTANSTY